MKALLINGSPRIKGNTALALEEVGKTLEKEGFEVKTLNVGHLPIRGCLACGYCRANGECAIKDVVNETRPFFLEADAIIVGSPVYFAQANGTLLSYLQRMFYSTKTDWNYKVGAAIAVARRAGTVSAFDQLNKFFSIKGMSIATSTYWNDVFGGAEGEAKQDEEGLQTLRNLARHIAFLSKAIGKEKETSSIENETAAHTNFIR